MGHSRWIALLFAGFAVMAQAMTTKFPDGSEELSTEALQSAVADKTFTVQPEQGPAWKWQLKANGYYYINIGNWSDSGTWNSKGSMLCSAGHKVYSPSCDEVRVKEGQLFLKRDSGEIVKLVAQ